jgi:hypothetical protein
MKRIHLIIILFSLFLIYGVKNNAVNNQIRFSSDKELITKIVNIDWDAKLTAIPVILPGGELNRQKPPIKRLSFYRVFASIIESNEKVEIFFHQDEKYINGLSEDPKNIRIINFYCDDDAPVDKKLKSLCEIVKTLNPMVYTELKPAHDAEYSFWSSDKKTKIRLEFQRKMMLNKFVVTLDITQSKVVRETILEK